METKTLSKYEIRLLNWDIQKNKDCETYLRAKQFASKNGFSLRDDISYNGFIYIQKEICKTENPHDGYKLELQIYDGTDDRKYHDFQQYDMVADFGNIMDETKYHYKMQHGNGASFASQNLEEVFEYVLKRETELKLIG